MCFSFFRVLAVNFVSHLFLVLIECLLLTVCQQSYSAAGLDFHSSVVVCNSSVPFPHSL